MRMTKFAKLALTSILLISVTGIILIYLNSQKECAGCEGCTYEPFIEIVKLDEIEISGDSILQISFVPLDSNSHSPFSFDTWDFDNAIDKDFDKERIRDTSLIFEIRGEKITNGSCSPYLIKRIGIFQE